MLIQNQNTAQHHYLNFNYVSSISGFFASIGYFQWLQGKAERELLLSCIGIWEVNHLLSFWKAIMYCKRTE